MNNAVAIGVGLGALALAVGGYLMFERALEEPSASLPDPTGAVAPPPSVAPQVRYPLTDTPPQRTDVTQSDPANPSRPTPTPAPLPALEDSDAALQADIQPLLGGQGVPDFLVPSAWITHFVVTIDNLDRQPIRLDYRPVRHVPGQPVVTARAGEDAPRLLTAANAERYTPYVRFLTSLDPAGVAAIYRRYYPLLQKAYRDLGYPQAYFNDRLVDVIDHLLETPSVEFPIPVVQPKVFFRYADPALEERSWGQKMLIRTGPQHMAAIKTFLRALRAELTAGATG